MKSSESLLQRLKKLYQQLFNLSLQNRTRLYNSNMHTQHHHEFGESLHDLIDEIINDISRTDNILTEEYLMSSQAELDSQLSSPTSPEEDPDKIPAPAGGLSLYFKNNKVLEADPPVAARLRRRIWDHIHSAHRLARNGDAHTAKIHADIAIDAMKTLSHYVPDHEYIEFFNMIKLQMNDKNNFLFNISDETQR